MGSWSGSLLTSSSSKPPEKLLNEAPWSTGESTGPGAQSDKSQFSLEQFNSPDTWQPLLDVVGRTCFPQLIQRPKLITHVSRYPQPWGVVINTKQVFRPSSRVKDEPNLVRGYEIPRTQIFSLRAETEPNFPLGTNLGRSGTVIWTIQWELTAWWERLHYTIIHFSKIVTKVIFRAHDLYPLRQQWARSRSVTASQNEDFVGIGKRGGETEAFLNSKNERLHTFENVCSEISSAISNGTREGTQPDFLWAPMTSPEQPLATLRIYSRRNPILTLVSYFISLLRVTTYCSYKRPIQISNKRIVKHKKNHLFCDPQERQSWPLKRQSVLFSINFLLEKSVQ